MRDPNILDRTEENSNPFRNSISITIPKEDFLPTKNDSIHNPLIEVQIKIYSNPFLDNEGFDQNQYKHNNDTNKPETMTCRASIINEGAINNNQISQSPAPLNPSTSPASSRKHLLISSTAELPPSVVGGLMCRHLPSAILSNESL